MTAALSEVRAELEADLAWRRDEMRSLRNCLLGSSRVEEWTTAAMRSILVMEYAHLEGFTRHALGVYAAAITSQGLAGECLRPQLFASALAREFRALRAGNAHEPTTDGATGRRLRQAEREVRLIQSFRRHANKVLSIPVDEAISMESNLGKDVLAKCLYVLGLPLDGVAEEHYGALEFIRRTRNDIAHGGRQHRLEPARFEAVLRKAQRFSDELVQLVMSGLREEWYRLDRAATH